MSNTRNNNRYRYRDIKSLDDIRYEKYLLKHSINKQKDVLANDWGEIKKPFNYLNMAMNVASLFISPKKKGWIPMIFSGYKLASSLVGKLKR